MARLLYGDRIAAGAEIRLGCSAAIFDTSGQKLLLTRRADNAQWVLPGGGMDSGESAAECCAREIREEIGVEIAVGRLIGVYSNPDMLITYADGNRYHLVALSFEGTITQGEPGLSDEVTEVGYFTRAEIAKLDLMQHHQQRVDDAFARRDAAFVR